VGCSFHLLVYVSWAVREEKMATLGIREKMLTGALELQLKSEACPHSNPWPCSWLSVQLMFGKVFYECVVSGSLGVVLAVAGCVGWFRSKCFPHEPKESRADRVRKINRYNDGAPRCGKRARLHTLAVRAHGFPWRPTESVA